MIMPTNKKLEIKEVLDNLLLPLDAAWCISSVRTDDESGEIFLQRLKFDSILRANYSASIAWRVKENFRIAILFFYGNFKTTPH